MIFVFGETRGIFHMVDFIFLKTEYKETFEKMAQLVYSPDIFNADTMDKAKQLSLITGASIPEKVRWKEEVDFLCKTMARELMLRKGDLVLDFGCGVGRLAKELCNLGCDVIGVDISPSMRRFAMEYVNAPGHFVALSPEELNLLVSKGLRCDHACAAWTFQHSPNVYADIQFIIKSVKGLAGVFVADNRQMRLVPVQGGQWCNDNTDIWRQLELYLGVRSNTAYPGNWGADPSKTMIRTYIKTTNQ